MLRKVFNLELHSKAFKRGEVFFVCLFLKENVRGKADHGLWSIFCSRAKWHVIYLNEHLSYLGGSCHSDKRFLVLLRDCKRGAKLDQDADSSPCDCTSVSLPVKWVRAHFLHYPKLWTLFLCPSFGALYSVPSTQTQDCW